MLRAFVTVIVAAMLLGLPLTADASVSVTEVGWWTRSPSPPASPSFSVGNAPDGALSKAALRVDVGGGALTAKITLTEADGQGQAAAGLQACLTGDTWTAEAKGDLAKAPKEECNKTASLTRGSDGKWTGDLTPLLAGKSGLQSVMIVPAAALPVS